MLFSLIYFYYINIHRKQKNFTLYNLFIKWADYILPFFYLMQKKIKNLKISEESHQILKKYCDEKGIKMYKFLENLIKENCQGKKDIYGEY